MSIDSKRFGRISAPSNYSLEISREHFEDLVREAVMSLPENFRSKMDNVNIILAEEPTPSQLADNGLTHRDVLYGLYEGVPLPERGSYMPELPDLITIFQTPIERAARDIDELQDQIVTTVRHEVAHYFGFSDLEIDEMGLG
ncbi:MAG: hypothetical protein CL731_03030 [Chloroflexi bacterium]|nr:hypothetical protein [Chloroflexota bacterium]